MTKNKNPKQRRSSYIDENAKSGGSTIINHESVNKGDEFKQEIDVIRAEASKRRILKEMLEIMGVNRSTSPNLDGLRRIIESDGKKVRTDTQLQGELRGIYNGTVESGSPLWNEIERIQKEKSNSVKKFKEILESSKEEIIGVECNNCGECCCRENISPVVTIYDLSVYLNLFRSSGVNLLKDLSIFHYRDTKVRGKELDAFLPTFRKENGCCIHYRKGSGCLIYKYRPLDCRVYPGLSTVPELELMECPCDPSTYMVFNDRTIKDFLTEGKEAILDNYVASMMKNSGIWSMCMKFNEEVVKHRPAFFWQFLMVLALDLSVVELSQRMETLIYGSMQSSPPRE